MLHASELSVELPTSEKVPCLSLYQPTHRHYPDNQQDPIRYRNLIKELESSIQQKYQKRDTREMLEPFRALAAEHEFWNHTLDGLAVLAAGDLFRIYKLQHPVPELAIVADSFHTKPLLRILQSADRYQVLALSRSAIKLFEGNRYALDEIDLEEGVPRTIEEALGDELSEPHQTVASYRGAGGSSVPARHGHGGKKDEVDIDAERFFRAVDRSILEHHSKPSRLPLMLAALPEYHGVFRKLSRNPFLLSEGIDVHPDALSIDELRERAWRIFQPHYRSRITRLVEEFQQARAKGLAGDQLGEVALAGASGRIASLLIAGDREIPGSVDSTTGAIEFADLSDPEIDDLLDDLGEVVTNRGGQVLIVSSDMMPTETGVAAIYRY